MSGNRKRAYAALLALGALALVVDRFVLVGPAAGAESAQAAEGKSAKLMASNAPGMDLGQVPIPELPFPRRLREFPRSGTFDRDLFSPPGRAPTDAERTADNAALQRPDGGASRLSTALFTRQHRLQAVLDAEGLKIAVVDGAWLSPGDVLDGCELKSVNGRVAEFACADGNVRMEPSFTAPGPTR